MGGIFYIIGKSSTGKDTIYKEICDVENLHLYPVVMYTTRPIRVGEADGREYYFVNEATLKQLEREKRVVEKRIYHTIQGTWTYFTVDDEKMDLSKRDYLAIGTLESYAQICKYYGKARVVPIYIEVEDGLRLERALKRERKQPVPKYDELCRRFLADQADYAEEKLIKNGINRKFSNDKELQVCVEEVVAYIRANIYTNR